MSRHHRRLLRRLRAAWSSRGAAVSLRRDPGPDGRWRVSVVPHWSAVDERRVVALQLALRLTRDYRRVGLP